MKQSARHSIERLFADQYTALVAFFYRRTRAKADAPDLAQEVYLRMLRVKDLYAAAASTSLKRRTTGGCSTCRTLPAILTRPIEWSVCASFYSNCRPNVGRPWSCSIATD